MEYREGWIYSDGEQINGGSQVVRDRTAGVYRRNKDEGAAESVVAAVSEMTGIDPVEMEPLAPVVDPGALNALFSDVEAKREVKFQFNGCTVVVSGDGRTIVLQDQ